MIWRAATAALLVVVALLAWPLVKRYREVPPPSPPVVRVPFAPPPRADYDARRLTLGLLVAAGFLVAAWRIVATIDWRPPSEADTPDLDLAEL